MKDTADITIPKVASSLAPCLSDSHPLMGPVMTKPMDIGIIKIPAQKGVESKLYPFRGSHIPCSRIVSIIMTPPRDMELKKDARLPAVNAFILNKSSRNMGSATRLSMRGNATSKAAPPTSEAMTPRVTPAHGRAAVGCQTVNDAS